MVEQADGDFWELPKDWGYQLGSWARRLMVEAIDGSLPELKHDLPGRTPWRVLARHDDTTLVLTWNAGSPSSVDSFGTLDEGEFQTIKSAAAGKTSYGELRGSPALVHRYGLDSFLWVGTVKGHSVDLGGLRRQLLDWLNDEPLTMAEKLNAERVRRALPEPPQYSVEAISKACWILESPSASAQGTAFQLEGYGFVTCDHVLRDEKGEPLADVELFHSSEPSVKLTIKNVVANKALDLAVFQSDGPAFAPLRPMSLTEVPLQAHVAVCGFPNYRLGDTCTLSPGVVVAHRMARGGVRRLLTNAGIVAGMSGGPAVGTANEVVGVCVTGAPWMQGTRETEDQAIVPISALDLFVGELPRLRWLAPRHAQVVPSTTKECRGV